MKRFIAALLLFASPVLAEPAKPDPTQQALGQMLAEAQMREAQALVQVYSLRAQLAAEKQQADEAKPHAAPEPDAPK